MNFKNLGFKFQYLTKKNPNNICINIDNKSISFIEMEKLSNQIANYFINEKFKSNDNICLQLPKSLFAYASIIACLKLGISYTYLDRFSPVNRTNKILKSISPKVIISEKKIKVKSKVILLKNLIKHIKNENENLSYKILKMAQPSTIAYVMFTSGSTGFPKGVAIRHSNVLNFSEWCKTEYNIDQNDIVTNLNPLFFDNSIFDIFGGLFNGACLKPFHRHELLNAFELTKQIKKSKATVWFSVPSLLVYLLNFNSINSSNLSNLRKVIFGGEGFPKNKLKKLFDLKAKSTDLINVYGPTETTCICSSYKITKFDFTKNEISKYAPFGKKLSRFFYMFILNENKEKIKKNEIGELAIGGKNVGAGYFNLKKETKLKFIRNPFSNKKNDIIYLTGDLVYKDKNGYIYFSSRKDNQIKYNGYRIELEEIEQAIGKITKVKENVVCFGKKDGQDQITCWISHNSTIEKIIKDLNNSIPSYMMPKKFIEEAKLPKNQNGKIDRKLLKIKYFDGRKN
jgi:D-alanine--poly(phosphoribitol) ligase subunit 1